MARHLSQSDTRTSMFPASTLAMGRQGDDPSQRAFRRNEPPFFAHWNKPKWGLFLLVVLAANVLVASLAWFIVGLVIG
jgi:hypothetical protein